MSENSNRVLVVAYVTGPRSGTNSAAAYRRAYEEDTSGFLAQLRIWYPEIENILFTDESNVEEPFWKGWIEGNESPIVIIAVVVNADVEYGGLGAVRMTDNIFYDPPVGPRISGRYLWQYGELGQDGVISNLGGPRPGMGGGDK